ncbi:MAG: aminodeoxychorismate synthase component I [Gemmataceae bacterium]|nr:aminodeoxychorismate synthase component I [Gemmataceae bacterium]
MPKPVHRDAVRLALAVHPDLVALESVDPSQSGGRFSIFGFDGIQTLRITAKAAQRIDPFKALEREIGRWPRVEPVEPWPMTGGWIGYLAYEAGRWTEPTAHWLGPRSPLPVAQWTLYDTVILHDAQSDDWAVAAVDLTDDPRRPTTEIRAEVAQFTFEMLAESAAPPPPVPSTGRSVTWNLAREEYESRVARVVEYIRAGDAFQVNLSRQGRVASKVNPLGLYRRLCQTNPAPFAAYIGMGPGSAVVSSSPELFLDLRGREVVTRPIKGTRPRIGDATADRAAREELASSDKDRAELNMIVDLERNDLGRVCDYGTVRVVSDGEIEAHPTVFHRTATIRGRLRDDVGPIDLLRATFPGGSITGAPKVRAMQIIHELEPDDRGAYCGSIGYIGLDGAMQLNLAIRTMQVHKNEVTLAAGGGIVVDSDPAMEFEETEAKARGMLAALGIENDGQDGPKRG